MPSADPGGAINNTLLTAGIASILGAIVGGGLKAFGIELPVLRTLRRQLILAGFGVVLLVLAFRSRTRTSTAVPTPHPEPRATVHYAQRGGPFVVLGDNGPFPQNGYWWNAMDVSIQNACSDPLHVQAEDFRLYVSHRPSTDGAQSFYPEVIRSYQGRLLTTWVQPGGTVEGRLVFQVPEKLSDGGPSNGAYHVIRFFPQQSCTLAYDPF